MGKVSTSWNMNKHTLKKLKSYWKKGVLIVGEKCS